jgi:hypothetical protein
MSKLETVLRICAGRCVRWGLDWRAGVWSTITSQGALSLNVSLSSTAETWDIARLNSTDGDSKMTVLVKRSRKVQFVFFACVYLASACSSRSTADAAPKRDAPTDIEAQLAYDVIRLQDTSYLGHKRAALRIRVDTEDVPSKKALTNVASAAWKANRSSWDELTVFVYLPEMNTESSAYGIGVYSQAGLKEFKLYDLALYMAPAWKQFSETEKQAASGQAAWNAKKEAPGVIEYSLAITAVESDGRTRIECATNFPDGTSLRILARRIYFLEGDTYEYHGTLYSANIPVKNGEVSSEFFVNDASWIAEWEERASMLISVGEPISIRSIEETIEVSVSYTSHNKSHSGPAKLILGQNGEFVGGPLAEPAGKNGTFVSSMVLLDDVALRK